MIVEWWRVLVVVALAYLLLSGGPWLAWQLVEWWLRSSARSVGLAGRRLRALSIAEREQAPLWPETVRAGRFAAPDQLALTSLVALRRAVAEGDRLWVLLTSRASLKVRLLDVASFRAWCALGEGLLAWRDNAALWQALGQGEKAFVTLQEQRLIIKDIPNRARAQITELRAELRRLSAQLEEEQEAGTLGLEPLERRLEQLDKELQAGLQALVLTGDEGLPEVVRVLDDLLAQSAPEVAETDQLLASAAAERTHAHDLVARLQSSLRLAAERWEGLRARGATEPGLRQAVADLTADANALAAVLDQRTVEAYRRIGAEAETLDLRIGAVTQQLDEFSEVMERSRAAVEGDLQALTDAQAACDELVRQDPLLEPDQSLAWLEQASQTYLEAEQQRNRGTVPGYEASVELAHTALQHLAKAAACTTILPESVRRVRELLGELDAETLGTWQSRLARAREQLQAYPRHWDATWAGDAGEAASQLQEVEMGLERISPNVRYERRFRQSELAEALDVLTQAQAMLQQAQELVAKIEGEHERIASLREELDRALNQLERQEWPALQQLARRMVPELQEQLNALMESYQKQRAALSDATQVNYDEMTQQWLPALQQQLADLRAEHDNSLAHYQDLLRQAIGRIDRQWSRLQRLNPYEQPGPQEDVDKLANNLEAWRAAAEQQADNPLALREFVGRRVALLEQSIDNAQQQIVEGRHALEMLDRQYHKAAQGGRSWRLSMHDMMGSNRWTHLTWETSEFEEAWQQGVELERQSRTALTLPDAANLLQQALNAVQQATQGYTRVGRQMGNAIGRLNEEYDAVMAGQTRLQQHAEEQRALGPSEELAALDNTLAAVERTVRMAENGATFDDILRYLREARAMLSR